MQEERNKYMRRKTQNLRETRGKENKNKKKFTKTKKERTTKAR